MASQGKPTAVLPADLAAHGRIASQLATVRADVIGARLRALRLQQGWSVRGLAEEAGVSKNSILRAEKGGGSHPGTIVQLCRALGTHAERLIAAPPASVVAAVVHRTRDDRWHDLADYAGSPLGPKRAVTSPAERKMTAARHGTAAVISMLTSVLPGGVALPGVIELFDATPMRSHPGEEFVYVLSGRAVVEVAGTNHELAAGESIMFRSGEPHRYRRAARARGPVRLLAVRINVRAIGNSSGVGGG